MYWHDIAPNPDNLHPFSHAHLLLKGDLDDDLGLGTITTSSSSEFVIKNGAGQIILLIDGNGNMKLAGKMGANNWPP